MKLNRILEKVNIIECSADPETEISGISYDSRKTQQGDLFVAVTGFEADGHLFIPMAVQKGAAVVLCERKPERDIPYVLVENSRLALALVSCAFFGDPSGQMTVIGVTGTSGKTTTTHLIKHIIEKTTGKKVGLIGTNGNVIGNEHIHSEHTTPESYELQKLFRQMADAGCSYVVMEVSSHSLTLDRVAGITFDVAAFTNLALDHLDFHKTMEEYALAKKKLFSMCKRACINIDDEKSGIMLEQIGCPVLATSASSHADMTAEEISLSVSGVSFNLLYNGEQENVSLAIPGMFSVYNALTAISCAVSAGISLKESVEALKSAGGVKGRVESVPTDGDYSIIIDYSHKPDSLEKVLKTLRPVTRGRLIVLFGCGGDRDRTKRPVMGAIAAENSDYCIVTSDNPRTEDPNDIIAEILPGVQQHSAPYIVIPDRIEAIHWAIDNALAGDVLLLAGKGHEDYQIIGHTKHHMDEREIVSDYLKERKHGA